jgi:repressor LexA
MPAVLAHRSQPKVEDGEIAAVRIGEEATLKRVFLFDDHIELRAENPTFPTILRIGEDMNTITIEGKAVGLCRGGSNYNSEL